MERGPPGKPIERIVISCVTFDTVKVTDPIIYYDATKAYLIRYNKDGDRYEEVFSRVKDILKERFNTTVLKYDVDRDVYEADPVDKKRNGERTDAGKIIKELTIVEVNKPVYRFKTMLETVFSIIDNERKDSKDRENIIYVNISAGTSEYSAAALIASMMFDDVKVFSVPTKEFMVDGAGMHYHDEDGKFVGLAKAVEDPSPINEFSIPKPDKRTVLSLKVYVNEKFPSATRMIDALKSYTCVEGGKTLNLWDWDTVEDSEKGLHHKERKLSNEKMKFQRQFIDRWMNDGLIRRVGRGDYKLEPHGKFAIDTYYTNE
jgi:hypothetical protein